MKKITLVILISLVCLLTLATITFSIIAIHNAYEPLIPVSKVLPTCTEQGNIAHYINPRNGLLYSDNKGENELEAYEVVVPALGHSCEHHNAELPTCTQDGNIEYWECMRCGKYFSDHKGDNEISKVQDEPATGHNYIAVECVWAADYSAATLKYSCTVCKDPQEAKALITTVDELNPTCEEMGFKIYKATVVNDAINYSEEKKDEIPAIGHNFSEEFTVDIAATCAETGSKSKHCTRCGAKSEVTEIPATGHNFAEEFTVYIAATCSEQGSKSKHCTRCDAKSEVTEIPTIAHTVVIDIAVSPDCTHTGLTEGSHCSVCGDIIVKQEKILAIGHNYEQGECSTCGHIEAYDILKFTLSTDKSYYSVTGNTISQETILYIPKEYMGLPIKRIGANAFAHCYNLTEVYIPDGIVEIGEYAFSSCSLKFVSLPNAITKISKGMFLNSNIESIHIPEGVTTIEEDAFNNCSNLLFCDLQLESLKSIESYAFMNCQNLLIIYIGKNVSSIKNNAFYNCFKLEICCCAKSKPKGWATNWNWNRPVTWGYEDQGTIIH